MGKEGCITHLLAARISYKTLFEERGMPSPHEPCDDVVPRPLTLTTEEALPGHLDIWPRAPQCTRGMKFWAALHYKALTQVAQNCFCCRLCL